MLLQFYTTKGYTLIDTSKYESIEVINQPIGFTLVLIESVWENKKGKRYASDGVYGKVKTEFALSSGNFTVIK